MIPEKIRKLTQVSRRGPASTPCREDALIGMEIIKDQYYPEMPIRLAKYLYTQVRGDAVDEYCVYDINEGYSSLKWKE